jgi:hypothetical protein
MRGIIIAAVLGLIPLSSPAAARTGRRWKVPTVHPRFFRPATKGFRDLACLRMLRSLKVPFRKLRSVKGVATPVKIIGSRIGRTRYQPRYTKNNMVMDCRLALAMRRADEIFRINGIRTVVWSNFYSWRRVATSGRLSRHALGLAIDIHAFYDKQGRKLAMTRHYETGLGRGKTCEGRAKTLKGRILRDLACDFDVSNLFESVLTPDYDAGHRNHFHLGVFHPQDRIRYRLFRTVLMEVRGVMYKWVWSRPVRAFYSTRRMQRLVKARWRARSRWYHWKKRHQRRRPRR